MNERLRRMGRHVPLVAVPAIQQPTMEPPPGRTHDTGCALCDTASPPSVTDATLDPRPRKGGRHRKQRT